MLAPDDRGLEARRLRDHVVGEDAAVAPAAHAEAVGIGDARRRPRGRRPPSRPRSPCCPSRPRWRGCRRCRGPSSRAGWRRSRRSRAPASTCHSSSKAVENWSAGPPWMRRIGGHARCPAAWPGGSVRKPSTTVPSALVAWKRSTRPSAIPFRKSSFARVRRRSPPARHRRDLGRLVERALEHDDRAAGRHVEGLHVALAGDDALDLAALDAARGRGAGCRRSSSRKSTTRPSGVKRGLVTLRSSAAVSGREARRRRPGPGRGGSRRTRGPSGRRRRRRRSTARRGSRPGRRPRRGRVVDRAGDGALAGRDDEDVRVLDRSGSGSVRLLTKAIDWPSGDQAGSESSKGPEVTWTEVFFATSKTWTCLRTSRR